MKLEVFPATRLALAVLALSPALSAQETAAPDPYALQEPEPLPALDYDADAAARVTPLPFYVSLAYGFSDLDFGRAQLETELGSAVGTAPLIGTFDETDGGVQFHAGYWVHPRIAIELGFVDLGSVASDVDFAPGATAEVIEQTIRDVHPFLGRGVTAGVRGLLFDGIDLDVSAKVGAFFWESDNEFSVEFGAASPLDFVDERSGTDLTLGLAAHYALDPAWAVQLELGHYSIEDEDALVVSVGVAYSFDL